jgi:hypothetical protein
MQLFYCKKADAVTSCLLYPVVQKNDPHVLLLSYLRYFDSYSQHASMKTYVKISIFKKLVKNFDVLSRHDFNQLLKLFELVYDKLPESEKCYLVDKVNVFLDAKGKNIDIYQGVLIDGGLAFFNDSEQDTIDYISYATGRKK